MQRTSWRLLGISLLLVLLISASGVAQQRPTRAEREQEAQREVDAAFALPNTKSVRLERWTPDDPVRIVRVMWKDKDVTPVRPFKARRGMPFQGGEDWLKDVTIVLKNVSSQEIVAGSINIAFPETGSGQPSDPIFVDGISFGRPPEQALFTRDGRKREFPADIAPIHWMPGEEFAVPFSPDYIHIRASAERKLPISSITTCLIQLQFFYFPDATRWSPYNYQKPDSERVGRYLPISAEDFRNGAVVH